MMLGFKPLIMDKHTFVPVGNNSSLRLLLMLIVVNEGGVVPHLLG